MGLAPADAPRPRFLATLSIAVPRRVSADEATVALARKGIPLTVRRGPAASRDLAPLLDEETIVAVAHYQPDSAPRVGFGLVIEFRDGAAARSAMDVFSDTRRSHLSGDTLMVLMDSLIVGYIPAEGQPDRAVAVYDALSTLARS